MAKAIVEAYDFSGIERIADVGGGHGLLLASILARLSQAARRAVRPARGDRVGAEGAVRRLAKDRVDLEAGSFFERVPDECDAYMMKHIIHDWSDAHCRTILDLMRAKLPPQGRVLSASWW